MRGRDWKLAVTLPHTCKTWPKNIYVQTEQARDCIFKSHCWEDMVVMSRSRLMRLMLPSMLLQTDVITSAMFMVTMERLDHTTAGNAGCLKSSFHSLLPSTGTIQPWVGRPWRHICWPSRRGEERRCKAHMVRWLVAHRNLWWKILSQQKWLAIKTCDVLKLRLDCVEKITTAENKKHTKKQHSIILRLVSIWLWNKQTKNKKSHLVTLWFLLG